MSYTFRDVRLNRQPGETERGRIVRCQKILFGETNRVQDVQRDEAEAAMPPF
jgi:hypothetical protein